MHPMCRQPSVLWCPRVRPPNFQNRGVVKSMLKSTFACQNFGAQVQSEVFEAGYIETWFAPMFFCCLEFWLELDRHVGRRGCRRGGIFEECLRPFQIQSRYAAFMVWLAVFFKFFMAFKGCVVEPPLLPPKRTVVWYWAYYVSAYCMIIRVDFNVWACVSVAIGRRCWFPIESNLFCREVHLHKMPAKNGVQ